MHFADVIPFFIKQIYEYLMPDFSQISGNNCIIIFGLPVKIDQILCDEF